MSASVFPGCHGHERGSCARCTLPSAHPELGTPEQQQLRSQSEQLLRTIALLVPETTVHWAVEQAALALARLSAHANQVLTHDAEAEQARAELLRTAEQLADVATAGLPIALGGRCKPVAGLTAEQAYQQRAIDVDTPHSMTCRGCVAAADKALAYALTTGSVGADYDDGRGHIVKLRRLPETH